MSLTGSLAPRPGSLMQELRARTAALHAAIEALPLMRDLMAPEVDAATYGAYLEALARPYRVLEPHLHACCGPALLARLGVRPRLPALERDLGVLGRARLSARPSGLSAPLSDLVPGEAHALGGLYVLEGATLGGRVISQRLRTNLGAAAERLPFDFLGTREDTSPAVGWRRFGAALEVEASRHGHDSEQILSGAVSVFDFMHRSLGEESG